MEYTFQSIAFIIMGLFICISLLFTMLLIILNFSKKVRQKDKAYLKALMEDRERIYQQFATELHDNISNLAATAIVFCNRLSATKDADNVSTIRDLKSVLNRLHVDAHNMSRGFVSPHVSEIGLREVMSQELLRLKRTTGLQTDLKVSGLTKRIPDFKKVMLYRIFQEAIINSLKHANAGNLSVLLFYHEDESFEMRIEDDGNGFDSSHPSFLAGVGLQSMHERAKLLKGTISITAQLKKGTVIHFISKKFWKKDDNQRDTVLINWHFNKPKQKKK